MSRIKTRKTSKEIFQLWNDNVDKTTWVPLEEAQKLETQRNNAETALFNCAESLKLAIEKIAEALTTIDKPLRAIGEDGGYYSFLEVEALRSNLRKILSGKLIGEKNL